ncbi:MAG: hypothetical protein R3E79_34175 [Caldilineaceae bacterium]
MKKDTTAEIDEKESDPDMLKEYDFSKGVRGKYVQRLAAGSNIVVLAPDVAELFPDSESVNEALRALISIAQRQGKPTTKRNRTRATKAVPVENK